MTPPGFLLVLGLLGVAGGLGLLWTGLRAQRAAARVQGIGTSPVGLLAAGEVRITGEAIPAGVTLTSRLRLRPALYYRAVVDERGRRGAREVLDDERGVGFFVRDATGEIRVFPRAATWEVPLDARTLSAAGGEWGGTSAWLVGADPGVDPLHPGRSSGPDFAMPVLVASARDRMDDVGEVGYREARIEPGDIVTVVGRAIPFRDLADPTEADHADTLATLTGAVDGNHVPDLHALGDPVVAESYRDALEAGILVDPAKAWGNAAIPGFGIGKPVRPPELDPGVTPPSIDTSAASAPLPARGDALAATLVPALAMTVDPAVAIAAGTVLDGAGDTAAVPNRWSRAGREQERLREQAAAASAAASAASAAAASATAAAVERDFELPPDRLVIAAGPGVPLLIAAGSPGQVVARNEERFLVGLLGAAMAIGGAVLAAVALGGAFGPLAGG